MYQQRALSSQPQSRPAGPAGPEQRFSWIEGPDLSLAHTARDNGVRQLSKSEYTSDGGSKDPTAHFEHVEASPGSAFPVIAADSAAPRKPSLAHKAWKGFLQTTKYGEFDTESTISVDKEAQPQRPPNLYQKYKRYMQADTSRPDDLERRESYTTVSGTGSLEPIRTISRVPGNSNYYEKDGLRTEGDGEDHAHEPPMNWKRFMVLVAMAFLWSGSQIPLYLFGGIIALIEQDIGGADRYVWIALGNLIPLAVVTPFVGALSDLFGRRDLALGSTVILMIGVIVCATGEAACLNPYHQFVC